MDYKESLIIYAYKFIGVNYFFSGNNPISGFDCSGYICEILRSHGYIKKGDYTANSLYNICKKIGTSSAIEKSSILFYGTSVYNISHCAIALNAKLCIEAGGGNKNTKTKNDAIKQNAFVRIRPIKFRNDLIDAIVLPRPGYD